LDEALEMIESNFPGDSSLLRYYYLAVSEIEREFMYLDKAEEAILKSWEEMKKLGKKETSLNYAAILKQLILIFNMKRTPEYKAKAKKYTEELGKVLE